MTTLVRSVFVTDRTIDFFSSAELTRQFGYGEHLWPLVVSKEAIDNSLDVCEATGVPPQITATLEPDAITISDNGSGVNPRIIERSFDYSIRVSDKRYYVSPTRGIGSALKCIFVTTHGESYIKRLPATHTDSLSG